VRFGEGEAGFRPSGRAIVSVDLSTLRACASLSSSPIISQHARLCYLAWPHPSCEKLLLLSGSDYLDHAECPRHCGRLELRLLPRSRLSMSWYFGGWQHRGHHFAASLQDLFNHQADVCQQGSYIQRSSSSLARACSRIRIMTSGRSRSNSAVRVSSQR
jgi:hypothetical protein